MSAQWYCKTPDRTVGPISATEMRDMALRGEIDPQSLVRKGASQEWVKAKHVKGLFESTQKKTRQLGDRLDPTERVAAHDSRETTRRELIHLLNLHDEIADIEKQLQMRPIRDGCLIVIGAVIGGIVLGAPTQSGVVVVILFSAAVLSGVLGCIASRRYLSWKTDTAKTKLTNAVREIRAKHPGVVQMLGTEARLYDREAVVDALGASGVSVRELAKWRVVGGFALLVLLCVVFLMGPIVAEAGSGTLVVCMLIGMFLSIPGWMLVAAGARLYRDAELGYFGDIFEWSSDELEVARVHVGFLNCFVTIIVVAAFALAIWTGFHSWILEQAILLLVFLAFASSARFHRLPLVGNLTEDINIVLRHFLRNPRLLSPVRLFVGVVFPFGESRRRERELILTAFLSSLWIMIPLDVLVDFGEYWLKVSIWGKSSTQSLVATPPFSTLIELGVTFLFLRYLSLAVLVIIARHKLRQAS